LLIGPIISTFIIVLPHCQPSDIPVAITCFILVSTNMTLGVLNCGTEYLAWTNSRPPMSSAKSHVVMKAYKVIRFYQASLAAQISSELFSTLSGPCHSLYLGHLLQHSTEAESSKSCSSVNSTPSGNPDHLYTDTRTISGLIQKIYFQCLLLYIYSLECTVNTGMFFYHCILPLIPFLQWYYYSTDIPRI
jgi:hypothetical protein